MSPKTVFQPPGREKPFGAWSIATIVENRKLVFISGITSRNKRGELIGEGDIRLQTQQVMENLKTTIEQAGGQLEDIVCVNVYVTNIKDFNIIHDIRGSYFPEEPPASTMVEVSRLVDSRSLIEVNAVGALPG